MKIFRCGAVAALCVLPLSLTHAASWPDYGGGADQSKYVALEDITRENVAKLEMAWMYPSGDERAYQFNPVIVDNVMYVLAKNSSLVAIDVITRKELWIHANLRGIAHRGVNYWESKDRKDRRILFVIEDTLQALDARTGKSILSFGKQGSVDLKQGLGRDPKTIRRVMSGTPGRVFENLIMLGSSPGEAYFSAPGHVRAFDVRTGELVWTFHTIPKPGEYGHDSWPKDAHQYAGGANVWGEITLDAKRGIAYFPVSSPTYDYYAADRHGANLFSDCLLALDARTGKRLWHFQFVHHDLWDYDPTAAPQLITVRKDGKTIDAVAQATKQGFMFVFDRVTGQAVWPIEERAVPASEVPGEKAWPTQPFSTLPPTARQIVKADDLTPWLISEPERAAWRERIGKARTGLFTPPGFTEIAAIPGAVGGTNLGNTAADPAKGIVYLLNQDFPSFYKLFEQTDEMVRTRTPFGRPNPAAVERGKAVYEERCAPCHGADRAGTPAAPSLLAVGTQIGFPQLKRTILYGLGRMPALGHFEDEQVRDVLAFLGGGAQRRPGGAATSADAVPPGPVVASGGAPRPPVPEAGPPQTPQYPAGVASPAKRYQTDYGLGFPYLLAPPWSTIMAYDLNRGVIKWTRPLGQDRDAAAAGAKDTGVPRGAMRQGMLVTSTGLVFATAHDGKFYAFDADTGATLWSVQLPMGSEGLPSIYEIQGKHYIVVNATTPVTSGLNTRESGIGSPDPLGKGGYAVFSLPEAPAPNATKPPAQESVALSGPVAPLPDGLDIPTSTVVQGLFAKAVYWEAGQYVASLPEKEPPACEQRGLMPAAQARRNPAVTTYWLYRSAAETVVFRQIVRAQVDEQRCAVTLKEERTVTRSPTRAGQWPRPFAGSAQKCARSKSRHCVRTQLHGIRTRCESEGNGFSSSNYCVSIERGVTRGLTLLSGMDTDDMQGFGLEVRELAPATQIPAGIFDPATTW